jgi:hypothetical protein
MPTHELVERITLNSPWYTRAGTVLRRNTKTRTIETLFARNVLLKKNYSLAELGTKRLVTLVLCRAFFDILWAYGHNSALMIAQSG